MDILEIYEYTTRNSVLEFFENYCWFIIAYFFISLFELEFILIKLILHNITLYNILATEYFLVNYIMKLFMLLKLHYINWQKN